MNMWDIVIFVVTLAVITLIYIGLGNQRKNVHGCTGGGLTVEKARRRMSDARYHRCCHISHCIHCPDDRHLSDHRRRCP
jgi:hypothetical protein